MTQQSSSGARRPGAPRAARRSSIPVGTTEVTDITTGNILADVDFNHRSLAGRTEVLHAPELDDLADTDNLVAIQLEKPSKSTIDPDDVITEVLPRIGTHRKDQTSATRGRVLIAAMAAGAAAAAAYTVLTPRSVEPTETVLAADETTTTDSGAVITGVGGGMQLVSMAPALNTASHNEELANGAAFAQERAEREARLTRPLFVKPTTGVFTSGFGYRWGALHGGIDIAGSLDRPIVDDVAGKAEDRSPGRSASRRPLADAMLPESLDHEPAQIGRQAGKLLGVEPLDWPTSGIGEYDLIGDEVSCRILRCRNCNTPIDRRPFTPGHEAPTRRKDRPGSRRACRYEVRRSADRLPSTESRRVRAGPARS